MPAITRQADASSAVAPNFAVGGHETILLVEDEESLRQSLATGLRLMGYRVLLAGNGPDAMLLWQAHGSGIDLLFTDMVMPGGMTGLELAGALQADNPGL
ncbi:response regulator, partial [bacterium]|nr:response regulator [bacterium]